jgi:hypothetical protein
MHRENESENAGEGKTAVLPNDGWDAATKAGRKTADGLTLNFPPAISDGRIPIF